MWLEKALCTNKKHLSVCKCKDQSAIENECNSRNWTHGWRDAHMWKKNSIQWIYILDQILTTIIYVKVVPSRTFNFSPFCTLQSIYETFMIFYVIPSQCICNLELRLWSSHNSVRSNTKQKRCYKDRNFN